MHTRHHRVAATVTATLAALALAASPAVAGEDDDGDEDDSAPAPLAPSSSDSGTISGAPQGAVDTGAGGVAAEGSDVVLLGLAAGALVLLASGGRLVAVARRDR